MFSDSVIESREMLYTLATVIWFQIFYSTHGYTCPNKCPAEPAHMMCGYDVKGNAYKMFPSKCALHAYADCHKVGLIQTPLKFCVKDHLTSSRRMYGESCPVFCPTHYRPVCGASKLTSYIYRTFNNGCYLDMINCRGEEEYSGYTQVPLEFCQKHLMKNIFKEQVVISNVQDFNDY